MALLYKLYEMLAGRAVWELSQKIWAGMLCH